MPTLCPRGLETFMETSRPNEIASAPVTNCSVEIHRRARDAAARAEEEFAVRIDRSEQRLTITRGPYVRRASRLQARTVKRQRERPHAIAIKSLGERAHLGDGTALGRQHHTIQQTA